MKLNESCFTLITTRLSSSRAAEYIAGNNSCKFCVKPSSECKAMLQRSCEQRTLMSSCQLVNSNARALAILPTFRWTKTRHPKFGRATTNSIMISLRSFRVVQMTHSPWDNILGAPEGSPSGPSSLSRFRSRTATRLSPITDKLRF
jgi:hypothetical protein